MSLEDLSSGRDRLKLKNRRIMETHKTFNYTSPTHDAYYTIELNRRVLLADIRKQKLNLMPGFRYTWHYSGMEVEPEAKYYNYAKTRPFVRIIPIIS